MTEARQAPRMLRWLDELKEAGLDQDRARAVLNKIRDSGAGKLEKEHFYRTLAQQAAVWLEEAARGEPFSDAQRQQMTRTAQQKLTRFIETRASKNKKTGERSKAEGGQGQATRAGRGTRKKKTKKR